MGRGFTAKLARVGLLSGAMMLAASTAWAAGGAQKPVPRLPDGTVDLGGNGIWGLPLIEDFNEHLAGDTKEIPYLPWTRAMQKYNVAVTRKKYDPEGLCIPPGGPRAFGTPYPAQFLQEKNRIIVIFEGGAHVWKQISMDGRQHPKGDELNPTFFGDSIGHWEGDTLVVDTVGFNERTWIDFGGRMHTEKLHTVERFSRSTYGKMRYEAVIDDPGAYSKPWTIGWDIPWRAGQDLQEYICQENNQYLSDLKDDFGEPFFRRTPTRDD